MLNSIKTACVIALSVLICYGTKVSAQTVSTPAIKFRVIGYLRDYDVSRGNAANFDFSKITHVNIAFINPDSAGVYHPLAGMSTLVAAAHAKSVRVLASIGGGAAPGQYARLLADSTRAMFVNNTVKMVLDNQLDGIDVDLEGARIDTNYERFVTELSASLKQQNKLLTAAVATAYRARYTDKALAAYDFINVMSYDKTGPWRPQDAGQHSPYDMAVADLDYWTNTRNITKEKINLGLPFYGYSFGTGATTALTYKNIIAAYPGADTTDMVSTPVGNTIYYNGFGTIAAKTVLAAKSAGGVMIWQLLQDADDDKSLLNVVNAAAAAVGK